MFVPFGHETVRCPKCGGETYERLGGCLQCEDCGHPFTETGLKLEKAIEERDQTLKRASDITIECGRLEARLEHAERMLLRWYNAWLADQDAPEECREAAEAIILRGTPQERFYPPSRDCEEARELARDLWWLVESLCEEWDESLIRDIEERVKAAPWMKRDGTDT